MCMYVSLSVSSLLDSVSSGLPARITRKSELFISEKRQEIFELEKFEECNKTFKVLYNFVLERFRSANRDTIH